ncbi:hypothetical protein BDZ89DRAFT_1141603 [Hymenopellis radicata]|nr:hypothetical protein BDZ89DRAFT_1141603 [Hymenopellis radicata]
MRGDALMRADKVTIHYVGTLLNGKDVLIAAILAMRHPRLTVFLGAFVQLLGASVIIALRAAHNMNVVAVFSALTILTHTLFIISLSTSTPHTVAHYLMHAGGPRAIAQGLPTGMKTSTECVAQ